MIQLEHVTVLKQNTVILKDINLTIHKGDKILLKGESGSGKSTLIKSLLYFEHFQGRILFNGEAISRNNLCFFRWQSVYISQTVPKFNENVRDFLKIPYRFKSNKKITFDSQKMLELLDKLNFTESILDKNFAELSGGEKQRLLILQMMMLDRPIYLLDEVTSALDKKNIRSAVSLITEDINKTIVSISHNEEWKAYCTRVVEMDRGEIVQDDTIGEH